MGLVAQKTQEEPREQRPPLHEIERAPDESGGQEAGLNGIGRPERERHRGGDADGGSATSHHVDDRQENVDLHRDPHECGCHSQPTNELAKNELDNKPEYSVLQAFGYEYRDVKNDKPYLVFKNALKTDATVVAFPIKNKTTVAGGTFMNLSDHATIAAPNLWKSMIVHPTYKVKRAVTRRFTSGR